MKKFVLICLAAVVLQGCAHTQLRWNTTKQSQTLTDLYQQQVLDNLAMFVENPHSVPHFAIPSSGGSEVLDRGSWGASPINAFRKGFGIGGDRSSRQSWALTPISDPDKLRRMRCAFQKSVGLTDGCTDCCNLRKEFLGQADTEVAIFDEDGEVALDPATGEPFPGTVSFAIKQSIDKDTLAAIPDAVVRVYEPEIEDPGKLAWGYRIVRRRVYDESFSKKNDNKGKPVYAYVREERYGRQSVVRLPNFDCNECCEGRPCWFCVASPKFGCKDQRLVGRYGRTVIYVPDSGKDELGRLVLEVMDYALKAPPAPKSVDKEVVLYLDKYGEPSNKDAAYQVVRSTIKLTEDNISLEAGKSARSSKKRSKSVFELLGEYDVEQSEYVDAVSEGEFQGLISKFDLAGEDLKAVPGFEKLETAASKEERERIFDEVLHKLQPPERPEELELDPNAPYDAASRAIRAADSKSPSSTGIEKDLRSLNLIQDYIYGQPQIR